MASAGIKAEHISPVKPKQSHVGWLTLEDFQGPVIEAGGSMQFVMQWVTKVGEEALAQHLASSFEVKSDISYAKKDRMMEVLEQDSEHIFQLGDLGYTDQATTKGQPRLHTCVSLIDSIYKDGFVTQGDPLLIWKNPETFSQNSFWMAYVKGHARGCTALSMGITMMEKYKDADEVAAVGGGNLLESLRATA